MELHIHSGDCARDLAASALGGHHVVYADLLMEGPVPDLNEDFVGVRSRVLSRFLRVDETETSDRLRTQLDCLRMELSAADAVFLWFDRFLCDQLLLIFVIRWFLAHVRRPVHLISCPRGVHGFGALPAEAFPALKSGARLLSQDGLSWARHIAYPWLFSDCPLDWEWLQGRRHSEFPDLPAAGRRLLEQLPSTVSGFDRLESELVQGVLNGFNEMVGLFHYVSEQEKPPFFGDDYVRAVLARLGSAAVPMVRLHGQIVTGTLQAMRSLWGWGDWRTLNPVRRWVANVCLEGTGGWRWDRRREQCMVIRDGQ